MTSALVLLAYVVVVVFAAAPALAGARWTTRAPRLGIITWHLMCTATALALVVTGLVLSLSLPYLGSSVSTVVDLCASALQHVYGVPDRHTASVMAILGVLALPIRLGYVSLGLIIRSRRHSRRLMSLINPVSRQVPGYRDTVVIDHAERYAFCLPGRGASLVVTSALLEQLTPHQVKAVLAHERAHKNQHHHLALILPKVLALTFGRGLPLLRMAEDEVARLVELSADDAARRVAGGDALAGALRRVTRMPVATPVLAASAVALEERIDRLSTRCGRLGMLKAVAVGAAMTALTVAPLLVALAPAVHTTWHDLCIVG